MLNGTPRQSWPLLHDLIKSVGCLALVTALLGVQEEAQAEAEADNDTAPIEEVVVTAAKRAQLDATNTSVFQPLFLTVRPRSVGLGLTRRL